MLSVSSIYWGFKIEPHWFNGCVYQRRLQILAVIFRHTGICDVFTAVADTENMPGFILLPSQSFVSVLNQLTHWRQVPVYGIKSLDWFSLCIHIHRLLLGGILVSLRPSVCPSVRPSVRLSRLPCPLCTIYSSGWILSILATNDHYY